VSYAGGKEMAVKNKSSRGKGPAAKRETEPKFPYTTAPGALRRFLQAVPKKPKPNKFDKATWQSWGFNRGNDYSVLRVLKAVNLLDTQNEPTPTYTEFMQLATGASALGREVRRLYMLLFESSHKPWAEGTEVLRNVFHIHSGGSEGTIDFQIQTFKALCENASFDELLDSRKQQSDPLKRNGGKQSDQQHPTININLHIYLPENKSRRDYEDMIEDIGKYIFGRASTES
jgi:hypothetical protein